MDLLFVGDVMLGRLMNDVLKREPPAYPWGDTLPLFQSADWRFCNLECVISDRGEPWSHPPKVFHFRSDAKNIAVLKAAGIDAVSLANNHTLDFEYEAMFEMLRLLDEAGIGHAGAGASWTEAFRCAVTKVKETTIGVIAFTDNEPDWEATERQPGICYVPVDLQDARAVQLFARVREAKQAVDFLIVSAHWGPNWGYRPQPSHPPFARALIDAGADVVFGHSCHVFQGIEIFQGRPIFYSAGDFVDDYAVDEIERNDQSFVFRLEVIDNAIRRACLSPIRIEDFQAWRTHGSEAREIATVMQKLCGELGTVAVWKEKEECLEIGIGIMD